MKKNKKILLVAINAKYIHSNLAVYSLKAYAAKRGIDVDLMEFTINQSKEMILRQIYLHKADVIMFSCYIWNIKYVDSLVNELHKLNPDVPIWLGGPEVSYRANDYLRENEAVKGIIVGEGEETFYRLCKVYMDESDGMQGRACENVTGTVVRVQDCSESLNELACKNLEDKQCAVVHNPLTLPIDMDELPFCYKNLSDFENRIIYYETSRGCPFSCSYCMSSIDKRVRFRSLSLVFKELQFFLDNRVKQVKFVDRTFNCKHEHAIAIWEYLKEHDNGETNFHFEVSADLLNDEELELISDMRPGLIQLEIGVQSTFEPTIKEIRRTMNLERLKYAVNKVAANKNIHQHLDLIAGLPLEDYETFKRSFDEIYALKPEQLQLGFLKVLSGSYMSEQIKAYGIVYQSEPPYEVMATRWLSYEDILNIKLVEEMLELHYNTGLFLRSLTVLERNFTSAFEMFWKLGQYYVDNGFMDKSYTRLGRCEIFYEFAISIDPDNKELYQQALIYDIYIKEKSKAKPRWSIDRTENAKTLSKITKEMGCEKKYCHTELFRYPVYNIDYKQGLNDNDNDMRPMNNLKCVVFDYESRDSLSNEAKVTVVEL